MATKKRKLGDMDDNEDMAPPPAKRQEAEAVGEAGKFSLADIFVNKKILAPLVGGSDLAYRLLCRQVFSSLSHVSNSTVVGTLQYGADTTFTEMCIADYWLRKNIGNDKNLKVKDYVYEFSPADRPLVCQLAGTSAADILKLATQDFILPNIDAVDINCGCPQEFAQTKGIGAFFLRTPDLLVDMCRTLVNELPVPLSVKVRIHEDVPTTIGILDRLLNVGVKAFTVHGRFWWQKGSNRGKADWDAIKTIRDKFPNVPIVGNGDVFKNEDIDRFKTASGVDSVMAEISKQMVINSYLSYARQCRGRNLDLARHIEWILKPLNRPFEFNEALFNATNFDGFHAALKLLNPPIVVDLPPMDKPSPVTFPPVIDTSKMSPSQLKKYKQTIEKKKKSAERKLKRRAELEAAGKASEEGDTDGW